MSIHHTQLHNDRKVANTATSGGYSGNGLAEEQIDENVAAGKRELDNKKLNLALDGKLEEAGIMETSVKPVTNNTDTSNSKNGKNKDKDNLAYQLALLDAIRGMDSAIGALQDIIDSLYEQIAVLKAEIEELDNLDDLIESGAIDPNNPQHAALMAKYGITQEDITSGDYKDKINAAKSQRGQEIEDLKKQIEDAKAKQGELAQRKAALEQEAEQLVAKHDGRAFRKNDEVTQQKIEMDNAYKKTFDESDELQNVEDDLTALTLQDIKDLRGSPAYITAIDAHIDTLSTDTKEQMIQDTSIQPEMLDRLLVDAFNHNYNRIQGLEGDRYNMALEKTLERADERTIEALSRDPNLPEDVKQILQEKEAEQAPSVDASRVSVARLLDGDERPDEEKLNTCFNNCAVGMPTDTALAQEKVLDHASTIKHENNGMGLGG